MTLRADLHVHTRHSKHNGTMPFLGARDCYSAPGDVYRVARSRGMDLVAITDSSGLSAVCLVNLTCTPPPPVPGDRISTSKKGSLLIYPKVELR